MNTLIKFFLSFEMCVVHMLDVPLKLLKLDPHLLTKAVNKDRPEESSESSALAALAKLHNSFPSSSRLGCIQRFQYERKFSTFAFYGYPTIID